MMNLKSCLSLLGTISSVISLATNPVQTNLGGEWQFKQSSSSEWLPATVPGCAHTDLMDNRLIPDPFVGVNEKHIQWIGERDWEYSRTFTVDMAILSAKNIELVMEGLDTYAEVYLNDHHIASCDNMFRTWRVDSKPWLRQGENTLRIYFKSIFKVDMPKYLAAPFALQAWPNNDQSSIRLSLYARKAGYNYGWDWGPRLITTGIWRDIYFESWDELKIDGTQIKTLSISPKQADMRAIVTVLSDNDRTENLVIGCGDQNLISKQVVLSKGMNQLTLDFAVKNPKLWWTNGLGEQHMYDFDIKITNNKSAVTERVRTGIRTIEVVKERDDAGQSLYVKLNGKNIFMKGANYIPLDNFPNRIKSKDYDYIINSAAKANMNMLRIWGGGIYESKAFYDACDRNGILVWQDMMFACGMFPADAHYLNNVSEEVKNQVKRLRNHPSIALWNGNNENEISFFGWGWQDKYTEYEKQIYTANLKQLFYKTIPEAIFSQDDSRYYHPTSPTTGYNGIPASMGDVHYWGVWKGAWPEEYNKPSNIGRFMSEYGFQSYPQMSTILKFAQDKELSLDSEVMLSHQRAMDDNTRDPNFGNNMMKMYMEHYFCVPNDLEKFIYVSQLLQAEAVKIGIEAHRRAKPYCMGTLYWQINDCWPVASWSSIDYYGNWKALHYFAAKAYSDILVSPYENEDKVVFKVVSDRLEDMKAVLKIDVMTLDGQIVSSKKTPFSLAENAVSDVYSIDKAQISAPEKMFIHAQIEQNGKIIGSNIYYPLFSNRYKYVEAEPQIDFENRPQGGVILTLSSPVLIRGLYLKSETNDAVFNDNFLTIVPGIEYRIEVKTNMDAQQLKKALKHISINTL